MAFGTSWPSSTLTLSSNPAGLSPVVSTMMSSTIRPESPVSLKILLLLIVLGDPLRLFLALVDEATITTGTFE